MGSQSGATSQAKETLVFFERSPYHADREAFTSMAEDFPSLCGCMFLQGWIGICFCHDPPVQNAKQCRRN
jgi:hypothetical protein